MPNKQPPEEHRFSSTNQPKRRKKGIEWKSLMKKKILHDMEPMIDSLIREVIDNGSHQAFEKLMDRAFGKVKDKVKHEVNGSLNKILQDHFFDEND